MATALTLVTNAAVHMGIAEDGQTLGSSDSATLLDRLKSMLDAWQLDPQAIIGLQELTYTPGSGVKSFTIGPAGTIVARQPVRIEPVSFYRVNSVDTPLGVGSLDDYNAEPSKSVTGPPRYVAMVRGTDTATVYVYPAGDGASELHLWVQKDVVTNFDTLTLGTTVVLPNGYQTAIEWCLAQEAALDFHVPERRIVLINEYATRYARRLKRSNTRVPTLRMPYGVSRGGSFNINEG